MILDHLDTAQEYVQMSPLLARAFAFLQQGKLDELEPGRHEIDGDDVYAMVAAADPTPREQGLLEVHRRYIDVHYTISGIEQIGWKATSRCTSPQGEFDEANDALLFSDAPVTWLPVPPEHFVICLPADAHAPVREGNVRKVALKIAVA